MDSRVSLCMIVKNEAQNIKRCLDSAAGAVDEIIVIDTGSTDNTGQIAAEYGALVQSFLWNENFSDARNASLDLATGNWVLFLDADEELTQSSREALRRVIDDNAVEGYFVKIINYLGNDGWSESCPDLVFRLFRNRRDYRFRGAIHEQIAGVILEKNNQASYRIAEEIEIIHYGYLDKQIGEKDKKNRNINIIQKELLQDPENRLLRYHYGVELFRAEKYEEAAVELIQAANGIDPNTIYLPKLFRYIVMSCQSAKQPEKALDTALLGLRFFPDYADLYYYAGLLFLELKQYNKAREFFQNAVSMPAQPSLYASFGGVRGFRSYYHLGQIAETFLDYEDALKNYISSLRDNPNFTPALESMVKILKPRENPEYTKESLEKVFEFCTPEANQIMGGIYFRHGAYQLALEYFESAAANGASSPEIQLCKAICLIQERRRLEALRTINKFSRESHLYPLAKINELLCFWLQDKKKKVRSLFAELQALGLVADTEKVLSLFLAIPGKQKKHCAVTLGQDGMSLLLDVITRLLDMEEINKVEQLLSEISAENLAEYSLAIARRLYDFGYKEMAEALLREHISGNQNAEPHFLLAEICQEAGKNIEAEQYYRRALELDPDVPQYYIRLLNLYESSRKRILQEAMAKYPGADIFKKLSGEAPAD
ncbi:MAG TPA: glycosyl transferase family 2 [Desulfotomaculum sp.]|nr:MAG: Uncharacterized protein XD84_1756 [Desulfotomaculum sp. 46_80]HAG10237.1 glycosyl transferase family 2 [Desulfotomaculum sp.]HBY04285.1 glycosyl transferase family 2 [Desulfotomaculum sp.]